MVLGCCLVRKEHCCRLNEQESGFDQHKKIRVTQHLLRCRFDFDMCTHSESVAEVCAESDDSSPDPYLMSRRGSRLHDLSIL